MAENSKIEWTHHTFNPWIGCQKVGPGCDHCYAEAMMDTRYGRVEWGPHGERKCTSQANWRKPLAWDRAAAAAGERKRVFCASLADVFDNAVPTEWRRDLWELIVQTPNLDWMLLTKRPGNIANMLPVPFDFERLYPNVWLGCTVTDQAEADRDIPKLLAVPAAVRFLSMEPLLGQVDLRHWIGVQPILPGVSTHLSTDGYERQDIGGGIIDGLDLVIVGGESGPGARPIHPAWARSLRDQCQAASVAFHFKQWGEWAPGDAFGMTQDRPITDRWGNVSDWMRRYVVCGDDRADRLTAHSFTGHSTNLVYKVGKKRAGRLLDGRTWDEMPEVRHDRPRASVYL
ncbi:DUF5131 family protein [Paracoccus alkanivorans]|uniref:Phage Gp37/Gp68 family protein n=1 Tax=Paracoccus alkanivorans TaxID=2116655 RepID=A0A3M0MR18_9RHOB|nr:phage Gp37/Gp68 family protein [Paracoccus alkanivorans]RMC33767.1 phage Gp37/Gp68 family protein [Paracoccus alkanivorans]